MKEIVIQKGRLAGTISVPSSKSDTHRALILAGLSNGKSKIISPLVCRDTEATGACLGAIGVKIRKGKSFWEVEGGKFFSPRQNLFCWESGTTLRLMTAVCSLIKGRCILTGRPSLMRRPIAPLLRALRDLGVRARKRKNLVIVEDNFLGGKTKIRGDISSQFISALLLVSPLARKEVEIELTSPLESSSYVLMTINSQRAFGVNVNFSRDLKRFRIKRQSYRPGEYRVEADWSSASFFLAGGAIAGRVRVKNLNQRSFQPDRKIIDFLKQMGAKIAVKEKEVIVEKSALRAIQADVRDCPDLFPVVCVLSAVAKGTSEISGIERLKYKESNRLEEMEKGLKKMGIRTKKTRSRFFVEGGRPKGAIIDSNDHRIVMAFAILGLIAKTKTVVKNPDCASKSFPTFFEELRSIYQPLW